MIESIGGTPFETKRFKDTLQECRDTLREMRLVQNRDLHRLERDLDHHDTVETMMRDIENSGVVVAGLAVLRRMYADAPKKTHTINGSLELDEQDRFFIGDVEIRGNLINGGGFTVTGNLTVHGNYVERTTGFARLAVGGDFRVGDVVTEHDIAVLGELSATGLIYARDNETFLSVEGPLRARILIEDNHPTHYDLVEVERHFPNGIEAPIAHELLVPDAVDENGAVDVAKIWARALAGEELIRELRPSQRHSLTPRMTQLIQTIRDGASYEFQNVAGKAAIRIVLQDGSRQISFVTEEEREIIGAVLALR